MSDPQPVRRWICPQCRFANKASSLRCANCHLSRPVPPAAPDPRRVHQDDPRPQGPDGARQQGPL